MKETIGDNIISLILSFALAVSIWIFANVEKNPEIIDTMDTPIPIEVLNKSQGLLITGDITENVTVTARAPRDRWEVLTPDKFRAYIDLEGLEPGLHDLPIQVECSDRTVQIEDKNPEELTLRLEKIKKKDVAVNVKVSDNPPTGFVVQEITTTPPTVTIEGPQSTVDKLEKLNAEIWLRGSKEPIERTIFLNPRDEQGNLLEGLTLEPPQTTVRVNVVQKEGYKDVSVRAVVTGTVAPGYWISNISVEPSTVVIVGDPDVINQIPGFVETEPVDVAGAEDTVIKQVELNLPPNTSLLSQPGIFVSVNVTAIQGGQTVQRPILTQGLSPGLEVVSISPNTVDIILSGSLPEFNSLSYDAIRAVVDLQDLGPGTYKIEPIPTTPPESQVQVVNITPNAVEVVIAQLIITRELKVPLKPLGVGLGLHAIVPLNTVSVTLQDTTAALQDISPEVIRAVLPLTNAEIGRSIITPIVTTTAGINISDVKPPTLTVDITYTIDTKTLTVPLEVLNLAPNLELREPVEPLAITITGPALEIFNATTETVKAAVDMENINVMGIHKVAPVLTLPAPLTIEQKELAMVTISLKPSATASPYLTPPQVYTTPMLLSPDNNTSFSDIDTPIFLRWRSAGQLEEDEWYNVQIWRVGEVPSSAGWTKSTSWQVSKEYYGDVVLWRVGVIRGEDDEIQRNLSLYSETRRFTWGEQN